MIRRILLPAVLGFLVLTAWTSVVNGMFGFNARLTMLQPPDDAVVYQMLKGIGIQPHVRAGRHGR